MSNLKEKILELRKQGFSYNQISRKLNCSKGSISYHIGDGQREKSKLRVKSLRARVHPFYSKIRHFVETTKIKKIFIVKTSIIKKSIYEKIRMFSKINRKKRISMKEAAFTVDDVIKKYSDNPKCYLTGEQININMPNSYAFDHIVPRSRGGTNTLDNMGICTKKVNQSKTDLTKDEYIELCKKVLLNNGYRVEKEQ